MQLGAAPGGQIRVSMDPALNVENSQSGLPDWATGAGVAGDPFEDPVNSNLQFIDGQAGRLIHKLADSLNERIVFSATVQESAGDSARYFVRLYNASGALLHSTVNLATGRADLQTREVQLDLSSPPLNAATSLELEVEDGFLAVFHTSVTREVSSQSAALYSDAPETPPGTSFSVKNGVGKLTAFLDKTGQSAFSYDRRGRLVAERRSLGGVGYITQHTYNPDDLPVTMDYPNGEHLSYLYDPARRLSELQTDRSTANFSSPWLRLVHDIQYDLDEFGELDEVQFGENEKFPWLYSTSYEYQALDRRLSVLHSETAESQVLQHLTYGYDPRGNIQSVTDSTSSSTQGYAGISAAHYDGLDRLKSLQLKDDAPSYTYDPLGNMTSFEGHAHTFGGAGHGPHQLLQADLAQGGSEQVLLRRQREPDLGAGSPGIGASPRDAAGV